MKFHSICIAICCQVLLVGCSKNDDASPTAQKLMAGVWQISASTYTVNYMGKDTTINSYIKWKPCEQDDLIIFQVDGEGKLNENSDKCPEDDQTGAFTWELQENDRRLQIVLENGNTLQLNGATTATYDILEVTETQLIMRSLDSTASAPATVETFKNIR